MTTSSAKISSKGQITLPAAMRRELGTDRVRITLKGRKLIIEPEETLYGSLHKYAQPGRHSLEQETDQAWELEMREKHGKYFRR